VATASLTGASSMTRTIMVSVSGKSVALAITTMLETGNATGTCSLTCWSVWMTEFTVMSLETEVVGTFGVMSQ
jgi:tetrahydromethanopterin S-methyltransferase subunit C